MTWWMIVLAVVGYLFIAGIVAGITDEWVDVGSLFIGMLWPLMIIGVLVCLLLYVPFKIGEFIRRKWNGKFKN